MRNAVAWIVGLVVLLAAKAAWAAFHIMKITEVFPGTTAAPNAQYIELQMYAAGQNMVNGHVVRVFDASGAMVGEYTFAGNLANGANQATILVATAQAATLFGVSADLAMPTATIPLAGGMVCFENIDCVAWGNFTGGSPASPVGLPAYQARGLTVGQSLVRKLGANNSLEGTDDTNVSAADFEKATPSPKNNGGLTGTNPASTCGDGQITGLEDCDDNNMTANDGCSGTCHTESCGDGIVQTGEECDDTNTKDDDTCSNACMTVVPPPDGAPDAGMGNDAGNNNNNGGGGGCCETGGAGASPWLALLVLGLLLRRRRA